MFSILLILIVTFVSHGQSQSYDSPCKTPDNIPGFCMPVKSCKPAYLFFKQISTRGGAISMSEREEIQQLHCGTFQGVPHVCCAEWDIQLNPDGFEILQNQSCGIHTVNKVTNGQLAVLAGYPWMALLMYEDYNDPFKCAGSLISTQYVLTAAHCIRGRETILTHVRLGEHQKSTPIDCIKLGGREICSPEHEDIDIEEFILHPQYRSVYHDIALIRLKRKVEPKRHIIPICLPIYDNLRNKASNNYVISGWGKTETGKSSDVLMVAVVPNVEISECESQLRPFNFHHALDERHICAGGSNLVDTCKGDSGGPLGFSDTYNGRPRFIQYGVVAAGLNDCGSVNVPGIYTNVSHHIQWITDNMRP